MRNFLSVILILFASLASAQSYPEPSDLAVNDFAGILSDESEARLAEKLDALRAETDVELVVVTLSRQEVFAPDLSLKKFARGIFNEWGVGDKERDDGVLVLVLRGDQAIRITLGKAYGNKADKASDKAVERSFLPSFRQDEYEQGIETGVDDLISNLVTPYVKKRDKDADTDVVAASDTATDGGADTDASADTAASSDATTDTTTETASADAAAETSAQSSEGEGESKGSSVLWYILGGIGALIAGLIVKARTRKCPECGKRGGIKTVSKTIVEPTETTAGQGERTTSCDKCSYQKVDTYEIAKVEKPEPDPEPEAPKEELGGGKAGKEGSTGKW